MRKVFFSTPETLAKTADELRITLQNSHREKICALVRNVPIDRLIKSEAVAKEALQLFEKPWKKL